MSGDVPLLGGISENVHGRVRSSAEGAGAGLLGLAVLTPLLASDGGYFPPAWGWSTLALSWVVAAALVLRAEIRLGRLALAQLAGLAGLVAWTFLSALWATATDPPMLEGERTLLYLSGALAFLLVAGSTSTQALLTGAWAAIVLVCGYGLLTRLLPERLGVFDPIAGYRLSEPLGYWNGLGAIAAIGGLLALGLVTRARAPAMRAAAAASLAVLIPALYFTFSRGAWIALGTGLVATFALDRRRLQLLATLALVSPPAGIAVWLASRSDALTRQEASITAASRDGHRLALALVGLAAAAAVAALALALVERRLSVPRKVRLAVSAALALAAATGLAAVFVRFGSPPALVERGWDAFSAPPPQIEGDLDLNRRLFKLSGSGRVTQWRVAWSQVEAHPALGFGAGSYERYWLQQRPVAGKIRDAHSLYLEALAELGPVGLGLLTVALGVPLVAAAKGRRKPLAPTAAGAYLAFVLHAGIDWDWELPAVTLTALLCAAALLAAVRDEGTMPLTGAARGAALAGTLAVLAFSFVALVGNGALFASARGVAAGNWASAETQARRAIRWAPWSAQAWQGLGEAELGHGNAAAARWAFREAITRDGGDWELWLDLARASVGPRRLAALERASELNPLSPEVAEFRAELGDEARIDASALEMRP